MTPPSRRAFPEAAIDWLVDRHRARVLTLGPGVSPLLPSLVARGHAVTAVTEDPRDAQALARRAPRVLPLAARAERLPLVPAAFDVVVVNQDLHRLRLPQALTEVARVLRPDGHVSVSYTVRDDSVPWVRRLAALLRSVDPTAMTGDYGTQAVDALAASGFFPQVERRDFRLWVPVSRIDLMTMVAGRFPDLPADRLNQLMVDVGVLYETSARVPQPLLLPYPVSCWGAPVDHDEFTSPLDLPDDGLSIPV